MSTNKPSPDELLSALYDGELGADDQSAAQRLLDESSEARREFEEFGNLSQLIRANSESAPPELSAQVLAQLERSVLLGTGLETASDQVAVGRRRASWAVAAASACAALLVLVAVMQRPRGTNPVATDAPSSPVPEESVELAESVGRETDNTLAYRDQDNAKYAKDDEAAGAAAADQPGFARPAPTAFLSHNQAGLKIPESAQNAPVGGIIEAIENRGGQITVVQLTVVDRREGLDRLQLLLSPHQSAEQDAEEFSNKARKADRVDDELVAVLVELPGGNLSKALADLRSSGQFGKVDVQPAVPVETLLTSVMESEPATRVGKTVRSATPLQPAVPAPAEAVAGRRVGEEAHKAAALESMYAAGGRVRLRKDFLLKSAASAEKKKGQFSDNPAATNDETEATPVLFLVLERVGRGPKAKSAPKSKGGAAHV